MMLQVPAVKMVPLWLMTWAARIVASVISMRLLRPGVRVTLVATVAVTGFAVVPWRLMPSLAPSSREWTVIKTGVSTSSLVLVMQTLSLAAGTFPVLQFLGLVHRGWAACPTQLTVQDSAAVPWVAAAAGAAARTGPAPAATVASNIPAGSSRPSQRGLRPRQPRRRAVPPVVVFMSVTPSGTWPPSQAVVIEPSGQRKPGTGARYRLRGCQAAARP